MLELYRQHRRSVVTRRAFDKAIVAEQIELSVAKPDIQRSDAGLRCIQRDLRCSVTGGAPHRNAKTIAAVQTRKISPQQVYAISRLRIARLGQS